VWSTRAACFAWEASHLLEDRPAQPERKSTMDHAGGIILVTLLTIVTCSGYLSWKCDIAVMLAGAFHAEQASHR
jgi:hypothetical protein